MKTPFAMNAMTIATMIVCGIMLIAGIVGTWKMFKKAGKPGWHAVVPILNTYTEYDICWEGWLGIVLCAIAGVSSVIPQGEGEMMIWGVVQVVLAVAAIVLTIMENIKLGKSFGKGAGFIVLLILVSSIGRLILGFDQSVYLGKKEVTAD